MLVMSRSVRLTGIGEGLSIQENFNPVNVFLHDASTKLQITGDANSNNITQFNIFLKRNCQILKDVMPCL